MPKMNSNLLFACQHMYKKKSNSIAYHCVREDVGIGELFLASVNMKLTTSDILTEVLPRLSQHPSFKRKSR
jgi:hypothetical protein